jgi:hypothetical protein
MDNPRHNRTDLDGQRQSAEALHENESMSSTESSQLRLAQTLQAVGALLTFQLSLDEVLENILNFLGNVVSYDSASIQLFDEDGVLSIAAGRGFKDFEEICKSVRALSSQLQEGWSDPELRVISDTRTFHDWLTFQDRIYPLWLALRFL